MKEEDISKAIGTDENTLKRLEKFFGKMFKSYNDGQRSVGVIDTHPENKTFITSVPVFTPDATFRQGISKFLGDAGFDLPEDKIFTPEYLKCHRISKINCMIFRDETTDKYFVIIPNWWMIKDAWEKADERTKEGYF